MPRKQTASAAALAAALPVSRTLDEHNAELLAGAFQFTATIGKGFDRETCAYETLAEAERQARMMTACDAIGPQARRRRALVYGVGRAGAVYVSTPAPGADDVAEATALRDRLLADAAAGCAP